METLTFTHKYISEKDSHTHYHYLTRATHTSTPTRVPSCVLTLTGSALGRQCMSRRALAGVAPIRVGAGASPAQQRVLHTFVHVWACGRAQQV